MIPTGRHTIPASDAVESVQELVSCRAGERLQLHRDGAKMRWFAGRKGIDHATWSNYNILDPVITQHVRSTKCILDGEILVWNTVR